MTPVEPVDDQTLELPAPYELLIPVEPPEIWCAGVTYERSRAARVEESAVDDVYSLVYDADRPELFLKDAGCRRTVGPGGTIGVRSDSTWNVPEPELGLVLGARGSIAGLTIVIVRAGCWAAQSWQTRSASALWRAYEKSGAPLTGQSSAIGFGLSGKAP